MYFEVCECCLKDVLSVVLRVVLSVVLNVVVLRLF